MDTSIDGTHSCGGPERAAGSAGVGQGGACTANGGYSEYCKAGLTCVIDGSRGRSGGVCETGYGRCPLSVSHPYS
jgi:hypothetical protein